MKNFSFEHDGKTLWYSRSVVCSMYLFVHVKRTNEWFVLVAKRGSGCPSNVGKWNVPGGYLDFGESLETGARRECYEETGVWVDGSIQLASITTNPMSKLQNIVCSFYKVVEVENIDEIKSQFSYEMNEKDEVYDIDLYPVSMFFKDRIYTAANFAFGHDKMIPDIFKKRIKIPWWKRKIISVVEKWTKLTGAVV